MAAVATAPRMLGNHTSENGVASDQSPTGFTAVNGRESLPNGVNGMDKSPKTSEGTATEHGSRRGSNQSPSRNPSPFSRFQEPPRDMPNGEHRNPQYPATHQSQSAESTVHKRKRSMSQDESSASSLSQYDQSPPRRAVNSSPHMVDPRIHGHGSSDGSIRHAGRESDHSHQPPYMNGANGEGHMHGHGGQWHDRGPGLPPPNYHLNGNRLDSSDAQLAEALQRDVHGQDTPQKKWPMMSRSEEGSEEPDGQLYTPYGQERTPGGGAAPVGPKRKRIFSNRTKTGCMTCRRRKKKCDEQHPQCNNCIRGGFACEGYNPRNTWQKPSNAKGPVPLQSKDGYPEMGDPSYSEDHSPRQKRASLHQDGAKMRPIVLEDVDQTHGQFMTSPTSAGPRSRGSYHQQPWPNPSNPPYLTEHPSKSDYRELPPLSEIGRGESGKPDYGGMPPIRDVSRPMHSNSAPATNPPGPIPWQAPSDYRTPYPSHHVDTTTPQAAARMALSIEQQQSSARTFTGEHAEKEKMLRGLSFKFDNPLLTDERERCKKSLWRFNNAGNPAYGICDKERFRLLKEIVMPNKDSFPESGKSKPSGKVDPGCVVETPFNCHYGYNISLNEDVYIGENCLIIDACSVSIGSKTWIGPNVTLITAMANRDMVDRCGPNSSWTGRGITIEAEVWIGANVTIYPGVTLKRGSTVEPGTVVKRTLEQNETLGPTPTYATNLA